MKHCANSQKTDTKEPGQTQIQRTMMQHLAYQPLLPTVSKYLQQKWDNESYELHRRKVKSAKPTINTTPPRTFGHLTVKLKKQKVGLYF
ncbi:hypothetical protein LDENG_00016800 [Lucifuga dentata]|nr:hypothetical protein LDENG_00016800 [Lucifuga dentata]